MFLLSLKKTLMPLMRTEMNQGDLDITLFFETSVTIVTAIIYRTMLWSRHRVGCSIHLLPCAHPAGQ